MEPLYYDETRFDSYLEQLGIDYPTVRDKPVTEEDGPDAEKDRRGGGD